MINNLEDINPDYHWIFNEPCFKEIEAALYSYGSNVETWNSILDNKGIYKLINEGESILRYKNQMCDY